MSNLWQPLNISDQDKSWTNPSPKHFLQVDISRFTLYSMSLLVGNLFMLLFAHCTPTACTIFASGSIKIYWIQFESCDWEFVLVFICPSLAHCLHIFPKLIYHDLLYTVCVFWLKICLSFCLPIAHILLESIKIYSMSIQRDSEQLASDGQTKT